MNQEQTNITTGKQIRHLRTQLGMTQEELAGELNVTRQALSNWERDVNEDDCTRRRLIRTVCPLSSVSEPLYAVYTTGILRDNTGVDISALVGTPRNEAGTPFYTGVKSVPRPVRLTAYITYLRQGNRYDLVVAVSDTVKHL